MFFRDSVETEQLYTSWKSCHFSACDVFNILSQFQQVSHSHHVKIPTKARWPLAAFSCYHV